LGFPEQVNNFVQTGVFQALAAAAEAIRESNRRVLHALVGLLGAADQNEVLTAGQALIAIRVIETYAQEADDAAIFGIGGFFGHRRSSLIFERDFCAS
jgi:hypothetical protein